MDKKTPIDVMISKMNANSNPLIARAGLDDDSKPLSPKYFQPENHFSTVFVHENFMLNKTSSLVNLDINIITKRYESVNQLNILNKEYILKLEAEAKVANEKLQHFQSIETKYELLEKEFQETKRRNRHTCNQKDLQIDDLRNEIMDHKNEINKLNNKLKEAESKATKSNDAYENAQKEMLEKAKESDMMQYRLNQIITSLQNQIEAMRNEKQVLDSYLGDQQALCDRYKTKCDDVENENKKLIEIIKSFENGSNEKAYNHAIEINEILADDDKVLWKRVIKTLKLNKKYWKFFH